MEFAVHDDASIHVLVDKGVILNHSEDWLLIRDALDKAGYYLAPSRFVVRSDRFIHRPHDLMLTVPPDNAGVAVLEHSDSNDRHMVVKIYDTHSVPETAMTAEQFIEHTQRSQQ